METKIKRIGRSERGITLIALLVMIIILVVLTAIVIKSISGDDGIIKVSTETAEDHEVESYREQINHVLHSEIIGKSTIGKTATKENVRDALDEEDWIKTAVINANPNSEVGDITVQVVEGYIYQIYYNPLYGKTSIDYIGKDWDKSGDLTLTARYEKSVTSIFATAEDKKHGVAKLELIYKQNIVGSIDNPNGEQKFDISKIGSGWYKIKATSNSGAIKYTWVKATNLSDKLTIPEITIETKGTAVNNWYGADKEELWIKISTNSPSATEIHYSLIGAHIQEDTVGELKTEGNTKYIKFQITETGITHITAHTEDGRGYSSEDNYLDIQFDNIVPELSEPKRKGVEGTNNWYKSDIDVEVDGTDLNGRNLNEVENPKETLDGYRYKVLTETGTEIIKETHIKDISKAITTREINEGRDGIYILHIKAIDKAGNESPTKVVELRKDTVNPTVDVPQVTNITETGFQLTISAGDTTSGVAYYEYYINDVKKETLTEGIWTPMGLQPNSVNNVKVIVYDNAGNSTTSINTPITTKGELKAPDIQITGNTRNGYYIGDVTIEVTDTSDSAKTRVARIKVTGAGGERTINGTSGSFTITTDGTYIISAWSEDAQGNKSDTTTKPAFTRDATAPKPTLGTPTTNSNGTIKVTATANETGGSGVASYEFQYKEAGGSWTRKEVVNSTASSYTYTYTGMGDGKTVYVRVLVTDGAGNTGKSAEDSSNGTSAVIPSANTAPTVTASFSYKSTKSIAIYATGKDKEGGTLTYTLYVKTASGSWQSKATTTGSPNSQVSMTAGGLTEYTDYYYKVEVRDNGYLTGTTGQLGPVRTYCPGGTSCPPCISNGYVYKMQNGSTYGFTSASVQSSDQSGTSKLCRSCSAVRTKYVSELTATYTRNGTSYWAVFQFDYYFCTNCFNEFRKSTQSILKNLNGLWDGSKIGQISMCTSCMGKGGTECDHGYINQHD